MSEYVTRVNESKKEAVARLKEMFSETQDFFFADYRGMSVDQITQLRRKLRENNAEFRVVKNRYAKIALQQLEKPDVSEYLVGPTAMALSMGDSSAVAKEIYALTKDWSLEVKGGIVDGNVFDSAQVEAFSKLPGRMELLAMLMGTMNAPVQNFVYALNAVPTKLVRTLQAVADQKAAQ
ncbi:50S ribosomal protein L10 [Spirochaeta africana]|uniref:Large ribosomal subunit protein uL10 n=1 Tax=Spirochaeta africana (strain ATCC 700263 / DSM 8902 / Z-7692) TaxID=889378 RepID=H9UGK4_SPIAZ|nr:50S ribosomal protein L10 [Spirochaeta africana]AFG36647.1 ribosomal protein L10 [Spirochaeta africana DSM 8902]